MFEASNVVSSAWVFIEFFSLMVMVPSEQANPRMMLYEGVMTEEGVVDWRNPQPLARTLVKAGITIAEVTLRTAAGLDAITTMKAEAPELLVGAGTVLTGRDADAALKAGAPGDAALGDAEVAMQHAKRQGQQDNQKNFHGLAQS